MSLPIPFPNLKFLPKLELSVPYFLFYTSLLCFTPIFVLVYVEVSSRRRQQSAPRGCRKLGLRIRSNISDEYDSKYEEGVEQGQIADGTERWRVKSLWIYPVKSCKGVELNRGEVVSTGMRYDRQFSFAELKKPTTTGDSQKPEEQEEHWAFVTQRQLPLLARVKTQIWVPDPDSPGYSTKSLDVQSGGVIIMTFPYKQPGWRGQLAGLAAPLIGEPEMSIKVPFDPTPEMISRRGYTNEKMTIWKDAPYALNMGSHLPPELSSFLGVKRPFTLFKVDNHREVYRCAPRKEQLGYQPITGFADAYPLHILNLASVREVEKRILSEPLRLTIERFRANIIITGPAAYTEETWKKILIGPYIYHVACRTARCMLPNVDPATGIKHASQPNKVLRSFRIVDDGAPNLACLGMQMVPGAEKSTIRVGDAIKVLETGEHFYIKQ
ncbi:MAG: hypothetical protein M1819_003269 [Sarea resinae]|nr:MAG: hypothetical protein M1819_003269 [Sarea resinae]